MVASELGEPKAMLLNGNKMQHTSTDQPFHCVKYRSFTKFSGEGILWKCTVATEFWVTQTKLRGDCLFPQTFHTRKLGKVLVFYAVFHRKIHHNHHRYHHLYIF